MKKRIWNRARLLGLIGAGLLAGTFMSSQPAALQAQEEETDVAFGFFYPQDRDEDEEAAENRFQEQRKALQKEIEALRRKLAESEEALQSFSLERELEKVKKAQELAQRALEEAQLGQRLQGYNRLLAEPNAPASKYWIGVHCLVVTDETRAENELDADVEGVVVESVINDSPAAKAEIEAGDVILSIDGSGVSAVQDLISIIGDSEGNEIELTILRDGDEIEVEVVPAERPQEFGLPLDLAEGEYQFDWTPVYPGVPLSVNGQLPDDFEVKMSRKGSEPAKIEIKYGDQSFSVTSDDVKELPEDIRIYLQQSLTGMAMNNAFRYQVWDADMLGEGLPDALLERLPKRPQVLNLIEQAARDAAADVEKGIKVVEGVEIEVQEADEMNALREEIKEIRELIKQMRSEIKR